MRKRSSIGAATIAGFFLTPRVQPWARSTRAKSARAGLSVTSIPPSIVLMWCEK